MTNQSALWVLVTDGSRARIVTPQPAEGQFRTALWLGTTEYPHRPPVLRGTVQMAPTEGFAAEVAQRLNEEAEHGRFHQLVLAGPGHVVHDVRCHLSGAAAGSVVGTVMRDLSKAGDSELSPQLAEWWLAPAAELV